MIYRFTLLTCLFVAGTAYAQDAPSFPGPQVPEVAPLVTDLPQPPPPVEVKPIVEGPQVALRFAQERYNGRIFEAMARTQLRLVPVAGEHPAPLSPEAIALCRPYMVDKSLYMRCGMDHYAVAGISFVETKQ